jgi:hypothetical protein
MSELGTYHGSPTIMRKTLDWNHIFLLNIRYVKHNLKTFTMPSDADSLRVETTMPIILTGGSRLITPRGREVLKTPETPITANEFLTIGCGRQRTQITLFWSTKLKRYANRRG